MKFHLDHTPEKFAFRFGHKDHVFLTGSCFAEEMGKQLTDLKFKALVNPGGIVFNPLSLCERLIDSVADKKTDTTTLLERDGLFYSYLHHSAFHSTNESELVKNLDAVTTEAHHFLKKSNLLILTFGTAFYYRHKNLALTVANCHKQPSDVFEKKLAGVGEIVDHVSELIEKLSVFNPQLKILFTVSPVKYLKDGLENNALSKATLLLSIRQLVTKYNQCFYFPAFELVTDDLRDYRFYKEDLAHPNETAITYVWEKFSDCLFSEETKAINAQLHKLNLALKHRKMAENSQEKTKLINYIEKQKAELKRTAPEIDLDNESHLF